MTRAERPASSINMLRHPQACGSLHTARHTTESIGAGLHGVCVEHILSRPTWFTKATKQVLQPLCVHVEGVLVSR